MADYTDPFINQGQDSGLPDWLTRIFGAGARSTSAAAPTTTTPEEDNERWRQSEIRKAQEQAEKARIAREYGPQTEPDPESQARIATANTQLAIAQANLAKIQADLAEANSPERRRVLELQIKQAETANTRAEADLAKALRDLRDYMPPRELAEFQNDLATRREQAAREFQKELEQGRQEFDITKTLLTESGADRRLGAQLGSQERLAGQRMDFDREQNALNMGLNLRKQEMDQLKAQDDWVMNMFQNQIASGRLSLDKASKMFDAYVERARLPTQIMESVSRSVAPLLPYMTSMKAGDIPMGFEAGGSMDIMKRMGGNAAGSYNPQQYAFKPVTVDPYQLAKQAGADFSQSGKVPDPEKMMGGLKIPTAPSGGSSLAGAKLPSPQDYAREIMGATTPSQVSAGTSQVPSIVGGMLPQQDSADKIMTDDEYRQIAAGLG